MELSPSLVPEGNGRVIRVIRVHDTDARLLVTVPSLTVLAEHRIPRSTGGRRHHRMLQRLRRGRFLPVFNTETKGVETKRPAHPGMQFVPRSRAL